MRNQDGKSKKDLRNSSLFTVVVGLALIAQSAWATNSKDGVLSASFARQESSAQGRALLTIEDLKTLLGANTRDPSAVRTSQSNKDAATGSYDFVLGLSSSEKKALLKKINETEARRAELAAQIEKDSSAQKAELRNKRRELQKSRISSAAQNDEELGRNLFHSLLTEANVEARNARVLEKFDSEHIVSIDFSKAGSGRVVNAIMIGDSKVWTLWGAGQQVAAK